MRVRGACMVGGVHGRGCMAGVHTTHAPCRYYEIQSMSERYTSYLNAFLFPPKITMSIISVQILVWVFMGKYILKHK